MPSGPTRPMKNTAMNPHYDSVATFAKLGWVPCDKENESVSKTLEYAFDDYCVAQMAKALGKTDDYNYFMKRAGNYKNTSTRRSVGCAARIRKAIGGRLSIRTITVTAATSPRPRPRSTRGTSRKTCPA